MLTAYARSGSCLVASPTIGPETVWIDLVSPTPEEEASVERMLGAPIPTRDEAREIEASSRLYRENGAHYMTAFVLYNADAETPGGATATFVLHTSTLVTVRYHDPRAFPIFQARALKGEVDCTSAPHVLVGLLEAIIDRIADVIERSQDKVETLAPRIFTADKGSRNYGRRLDEILRGIGRQGDITARLEESAFSLERLLVYLGAALRERGEPAAVLARVETAQKDVQSLSQQMRFLMDRVMFLLDATLGSISIDQNRTMKVFSLVAATLMPPTLVGAIYGMNFKHIPELDWIYGYPMAIGLMLIAAVLPYIYFRSKGWL